MAQLPPKIPTMAQNWPSLPQQRMASPMTNCNPTNAITTTAATPAPPSTHQHQAPPQQQPSWVDEFLDFSSARRGAHRRSASDSIAFLETSSTFLEECGRNSATCMAPAPTNGFDRFDDDQLMSMFNDDLAASLPPNPSTPSDQNSNNEEKPLVSHHQRQHRQQQHQQHQPLTNEPGEVESSCKPELSAAGAPSNTSNDHIIDPKRVKRILANRQSAQRSRVRKLQYISELERSVTTLQSEVSALSPRVAFLDHQRLILNVDNSALKQRIAALAQDKIFKDAHQEALKEEIERLRQIYHQQNLKKMGNPATNNGHCSDPLSGAAAISQPQPTSDLIGCTDKELLLS